jgi:hypothetical protein
MLVLQTDNVIDTSFTEGLWRSSEEREIEAAVPDEKFGSVRLTGLYARVAGSRKLAVILHGLGGNAGATYCHRAAMAARQKGYSSLRLSLRGADLQGEDLFHPGLTGDLFAVLNGSLFRHYDDVMLFGFSLGGSFAIRAGCVDPRVRSIIAVCPPLNLEATVHAIDSPGGFVYRRYILSKLLRAYAALDERGRAPVPYPYVRCAKTIGEFIERTVVPQFGFENLNHVYDDSDARPYIESMEKPLLVLSSSKDPIVPAAANHDALRRASTKVMVQWVEGAGHMRFPSRPDSGGTAWELDAIDRIERRSASPAVAGLTNSAR